MSKTKPFGANRCPNCGEYGSHFCGPSFGEPGFFICEQKAKPRNRANKDAEITVKEQKKYAMQS